MMNLVRRQELKKVMKTTGSKDAKLFIDYVCHFFASDVLILRENNKKQLLTEDDLKFVKKQGREDIRNHMILCYNKVWSKRYEFDLSDFDYIYDECINIYLCNNIISPN